MNRRLADRHNTVLQAFAFLFKYQKLANNEQESNYNLARAFHQLGINHLALPLYEKVLNDVEADKEVNLKREAAYNLSLIYKASGSPHLAAKVLQEFCTI
jgi:general transcription factor 3C polypeptide 3 (transcription factor C subunit 4)